MYFSKILIANRGEIAVRIMRTCRELEIATVAVYSDADSAALHVRLADEAVRIGAGPATASYLRIAAIIEAALHTGAQAIHPGYGFLAERAAFARACRDAGLVFIGPPPEAIDLLGAKIAAKRLALAAHVPTAAAYLGDDQSTERLRAEAAQIGFPLLIKASAGGGGKGMRVVPSAAAFGAALEAARREALAVFGDDAVLLEQLIARPRHIEIQVLADTHGNCVHMFERECSIQRRHQKILEESPAPMLSPADRATIGAAAVRLALQAGYVNAGTVEFVVDAAGQPYFLEMNTRLQVEHPVTEAVTGYDLVRLQIAIAAGAPLPFSQADLAQRGHAIEVRVYAEDPIDFLPATGMIALFHPPVGPGLRNDPGVESGDAISVHYDPMLAKLIVHAPDRAAALDRLRAALDAYVVLGITTNLPLLQAIVAHPAFAAGATTTAFLDEYALNIQTQPALPPEVLLAAALLDAAADAHTSSDPWTVGPWRLSGSTRTLRYQHGDNMHVVTLSYTGAAWHALIGAAHFIARIIVAQPDLLVLECAPLASDAAAPQPRIQRFAHVRVGQARLLHWRGCSYRIAAVPQLRVDALGLVATSEAGSTSVAPMPGTITRLLVVVGQQVTENQPLIVLEAMKMEQVIVAPYAGVVRRLPYSVGALVAKGAALVELDPLGSERGSD